MQCISYKEAPRHAVAKTVHPVDADLKFNMSDLSRSDLSSPERPDLSRSDLSSPERPDPLRSDRSGYPSDSMGSLCSSDAGYSTDSLSGICSAGAMRQQGRLEHEMRGCPEGFLEFVAQASALDMHAEALASALNRYTTPGAPLPGSASAPGASYLRAAQKLIEAAEGPVFFAEGHPYTLSVLVKEYPELTVLGLDPGEMFMQSEVCPGIWVETQQFIDLSGLAPLRRQLRRLGLKGGPAAAKIIQALLGM